MERIELIIIIGWVANLAFNLAKNGEPKDGEYSFLTCVCATLLSWCVYHFYCGLF